MELYKENKVNPFGGCLPMVLQMPIFYGLYQVLWRSVSFQRSFDFLWITDLSLNQIVYLFYQQLCRLLVNELNILPSRHGHYYVLSAEIYF
jgi:YidC/Oxa1 family membrane protein insertase